MTMGPWTQPVMAAMTALELMQRTAPLMASRVAGASQRHGGSRVRTSFWARCPKPSSQSWHARSTWLVGATSHVRAAVFSHHVFGGSQSMSKEEQLKWLAELLAMGGGGGVFGAKGSAGHGEAKGEGGTDDAASTDDANAGQTRQLSADARTALQTMLQGLDPATLRELVPCSHPDCPHNHGHAGDGDGDTGAPTGKGGKKRRKKGKGKKKGSDLVLPANHPMAKYMRKPRRGASKQKLKVSNTLALVYDCYEKKILADDVDDRDGVRCTTPRARSLCMCD